MRRKSPSMNQRAFFLHGSAQPDSSASDRADAEPHAGPQRRPVDAARRARSRRPARADRVALGDEGVDDLGRPEAQRLAHPAVVLAGRLTVAARRRGARRRPRRSATSARRRPTRTAPTTVPVRGGTMPAATTARPASTQAPRWPRPPRAAPRAAAPSRRRRGRRGRRTPRRRRRRVAAQRRLHAATASRRQPASSQRHRTPRARSVPAGPGPCSGRRSRLR